jgi:hypothetical protein
MSGKKTGFSTHTICDRILELEDKFMYTKEAPFRVYAVIAMMLRH